MAELTLKSNEKKSQNPAEQKGKKENGPNFQRELWGLQEEEKN